MNFQHKELVSGRWFQMPFVEQMANIGSEVGRFISWRAKNNASYSAQAFERALELIDITMEDIKNVKKLKEVARVREALVGLFLGSRDFIATEESWKRYFMFFAYAARKNKV